MISYREATVIRTSSIESALAQVDGMSEQQMEEFVKGKVEALGVRGVLNLVMKTLTGLARSNKTAAAGDMGWAQNKAFDSAKEEDPRPSKLKYRINVAGDWLYLLAILIAIGTGGGSDLGGSWSDIFKGFAAASGTAFMGWAFKKISSYLK